MYYAKELFVKRGPLSTLWLAGSLLRKVTKQQILQADVNQLWSGHEDTRACTRHEQAGGGSHNG
jgi:hypothetical protein